MKIIITGSSGFIGTALYKVLSPDNEVIRIDKIKPENTEGFFEIDLLNPGNIEKSVAKISLTKPDVLIHCASILATRENHRDINLLYNNLKISESAIKIARMFNFRKIINLSTIGVYPAIDGIYDEKSEIGPGQNFEALYGLSKFCSEELFRFMLNDSETKIINLRLSQTTGPGMRSDRIYSVMLNELEITNKITVFGNGMRTSSFMSVDFLVSAIRKIIYMDDVEGTFNIGERNISYLDLAREIISVYGNDESEIILLATGQKSSVRIDTGRIDSILNKQDVQRT